MMDADERRLKMIYQTLDSDLRLSKIDQQTFNPVAFK